MTYSRPIKSTLQSRLQELPKHIQILAGPRQVGKTTLVEQVLDERPKESAHYATSEAPEPLRFAEGLSASFVSRFDSGRPPPRDGSWIIEQWRRAQAMADAWHVRPKGSDDPEHFALVLDEVQKIPDWSNTVKGLWDQQRRTPIPLHLVLLGSAPLLMQKGLSESLAGRFETIPMTHWSFEEMNEAFGINLDEFIFFGGYPGGAAYFNDNMRWRSYVQISLIDANIQKDIFEMTRVDKPALLKQLFELGCLHSGQILSHTKAVGRLQDAGNTTTLTGYIELLQRTGLLAGLQKYAATELRKRGSPPKYQVFNNALVSAQSAYTFQEALQDKTHWGRLVESTVGAHLLNTARADGGLVSIHYWREADWEVDFIVQRSNKLAAIEVKSSLPTKTQKGLEEFIRRHPHCKRLLVGSQDLPLDEFLRYPAAHWVE